MATCTYNKGRINGDCQVKDSFFYYCIIDVAIKSAAAAANIVKLSLIIDVAQKSIESREKSKQNKKKYQMWYFFSLSGSNLGGVSDLLGPSPQLRGVPSLGLHLPARKPLHGRPGPELQQLSGASGPGGQSESGTRNAPNVHTVWLLSVCYSLSLVSYSQRVAEQGESEGYVHTELLFLLKLTLNSNFSK